ncbi:MAG: hypothetical protein EHM58_12705 [Ignavibacteriae bacterium]|nr:MAG: hypothetical protein EHM58_12705 [Ignavibacteriota bacterium]
MKTKYLFKGLAAVFLLLAVAITGCSKLDSLTGPTGPKQNQQISFQISQQEGENGGLEFLFKPSMDTKISKIVCRLPEQQFEETLTNNDPNYVFQKDNFYDIEEFTHVTAGQQWKFDFTGNSTTGTNTAYTVTSDYTVQ